MTMERGFTSQFPHKTNPNKNQKTVKSKSSKRNTVSNTPIKNYVKINARSLNKIEMSIENRYCTFGNLYERINSPTPGLTIQCGKINARRIDKNKSRVRFNKLFFMR